MPEPRTIDKMMAEMQLRTLDLKADMEKRLARIRGLRSHLRSEPAIC